MKINQLIIILILSTLCSACFAPINSTFESARLLDKGEIELQGNYSSYHGSTFLEDGSSNINNNVGLAVGYGISDRFNMKFRYERMKIKAGDFEFLGEEIKLPVINYFEISNKFQLKQDKIAFSLPLGIYTTKLGESVRFVLDPRFFFTFFQNEKFEVNLIPKAHIFIGNGVVFMPGMNLGLGFSNDLNKWAIRPEIGFDGYFTYGVGANFYIKPNKGE